MIRNAVHVGAAAVLAIAAGQCPAPAEAAPAYRAPRNGFGQPDLGGTWTNETLTRMERGREFGDRLIATPDEAAALEGARRSAMAADERPADLSKPVDPSGSACAFFNSVSGAACAYNSAWIDGSGRLMRVDGRPRTSLVTVPADGRIPYRSRPAGLGPSASDNPETRALADRCLVGLSISTGAIFTPTFYNNTYLIQQSRDTVAIVVEMSHDVRQVRLGGAHGTLPQWLGDSVGRWEGDTLVVDTINFHPQQLTFNSPQLHLVERFTRVGPDRLRYAFRVEDPIVYSQPWGGEYEFTPSKGPQYEFACHEGNYGLVGILEGARAEERRATTAETAGR